MIEVVFSESVCGTLKIAQSYGKGPYRNSIFAVFQTGGEPSKAEVEEAQRKAEERERRLWENAIPLGGNAADVYCLGLSWSVGEISEAEIGDQRRHVLEEADAVWPGAAFSQNIETKLQTCKAAANTVCERSAAGEAIRVWYSHNPDEACGFYWLMAQLHGLKHHGPVYMVKLPEWEYADDDTVIQHTGWGEMEPGRVGHYLPLQQEVSPALLAGCAAHWKQLQKENAPLRVVFNGRLVSAPADIYDSFIERELAAREGEFKEAPLIGDVLGKYQLGISDVWVHRRIETMIRVGLLELVEEAPGDHPVYARMLRKCKGGSGVE